MSRAIAADLQRLIRSQPRWWRVTAIVSLAASCGLVLPRGGAPAALSVVISAFAIVGIVRLVADRKDRRLIAGAALLALFVREALVGGIDVALLLRSGSSIYAPDEGTYWTAAISLSRHWLNMAAPFDATNPYLRSLYVQAMAVLFVIFGQNLVLIKVLNTMLSVVIGPLAYRIMKNLGMPGPRWAALLLMWFPSIVFWSALALKDAYVLFFLMASLWTSSEFVRTRDARWLLATILALVPIESVRSYIFVIAAMAWIAVAAAVSPWRTRLVTGAGVTLMVAFLILLLQPIDLGPNPFYIPLLVRTVNAQFAQSSYVEAPPAVRGQPGDSFVVVVPGRTAVPGTTPRTVFVSPGDHLAVAPAGSPDAQSIVGPNGSPAVVVRPGDIVVIAGGPPTPSVSSTPFVSPTPTPSSTRPIAVVQPDGKNAVAGPAAPSEDTTTVAGSFGANLRFLPVGLAYLLFAPFPWTLPRTLEQAATLPEMLLWYACLVFALIGTVKLLGARDFRYAQGFAAAAGLLLVLALISSNLGTLVRSRDMLVPYVVMLAAVGLHAATTRVPPGSRWSGIAARLIDY